MVAKPVIIGDVYFPRKGDAQQACRDLLYRYPPGSVIDDPPDEAFLHDLLELHQDAAGKRGVGIDHFEVRLTEEFHQPGFFIIRVDGTVTDFSFLRCLTPATHRDRVLTAMRRAVKDQVVAFKQEALAEDGPRSARSPTQWSPRPTSTSTIMTPTSSPLPKTTQPTTAASRRSASSTATA
ncbi:hypothetical protein ABIA31_000306 [Catenulispora sp. MAP5-51]